MLSSEGNKRQGSWLFERTTSSYRMILRKREDTGCCNRKYQIALFRELALEETKDRS